MALVKCPDCGRDVSSRAKQCPDCACPVAEVLAEEAQAAALVEARETRRHVGEVDCPECDARGFRRGVDRDPSSGEERPWFSWCPSCEQSGRVALFHSSAGYHAVAYAAVERFAAGEVDSDADGVHDIGPERPTRFRYPQAGERKKPG